VKPGAVVSPIPAREYARPAPRPAYSVLDTGLFRAWTGHAMPTWSQALKDYLVEEKMI
jgi:dTDP-4-dehydrorhamnose reductase